MQKELPMSSRACGMLMKIRHYVSESTLLSIYYAIFSSILTYGSQIFGQIQNIHINRLQKLQDRSVRLINFAKYNDHRNPLYLNFKILKFSDSIQLSNFLFVHDCIRKNIPLSLQNSFNLVSNVHNYGTRNALQYHMALPKIKTKVFGLMSIKYQSSLSWNTLNSKFNCTTFYDKSRSFCKRFIKDYLINMKNFLLHPLL